MAALLSSEMDGAEREKFFVDHIDDCRRMGIEVLQPDVNAGEMAFSVASEEAEGPLRPGGDQGGRHQGGRGVWSRPATKAGPFQRSTTSSSGLAADGRHPGERRDPDQGRRPRLPQGPAEPAPGDPAPGRQGRDSRLQPGQEQGPAHPLFDMFDNSASTAVAEPSTATITLPDIPELPDAQRWPRRRRRSAST